MYARNSVVKTHFANILVDNRHLADNYIEAMDKFFEGCKTGNTKFNGQEAIDVIKKSGGIPVWAHPLGGEGEEHISEDLLLEQLEYMKKIGIKGLECYYSRYTQKEIEFLVNTAKSNNLYISGGSDYHGTNKDIPIGKLNTDNYFVDPKELTILLN